MPRHQGLHVSLAAAVALVASLVASLAARPFATAPSASRADELPFAPGERMTYEGRVRRGVSGGGSLWIEGPTTLRGTVTWVLHSDMEGRVGPIRASDRSASWLDPERMTALRYTARERHIISRHDDAVEIDAGAGRWSSAEGASGTVASPLPLDELSFLYYVRTLPLDTIGTTTASRHYDAARNPTEVRVVGRDTITTGAGRFRAVIVEMRVRDARRYRGEGTITLHLSDDRCRLILRLESRVPESGTAVLGLRSYEGTRTACAARLE